MKAKKGSQEIQQAIKEGKLFGGGGEKAFKSVATWT